MTVDELRSNRFDTTLTVERELDDGPSFTAYLVSYEHAGLKLHAMIAAPRGEPPTGGFPVVIANHGYVPDPRKYGITSEGVDSRPGDYYRSVPELYASRGFLAVLPDYRGHNSSEGFDYIDPQDEFSAAYYAEDVVAIMSALDDLENVNLDEVFMWSHSMGGIVSMRALLATDIVKAASFWSTMSVDDLLPHVEDLDVPLIIHHSTRDESTAIENSNRLAEALRPTDTSYTLHRYDSSDHFFDEGRRQHTGDLDAEFFLRALNPDGIE